MGPLAAAVSAVVASGLGVLGLPGAAVAHHPAAEGEGGPWFLLFLLVLVVAFLAFWAVSSLLERREERPPPEPRRQGEGE